MRKILFCAMIGVLALSVGCKKADTPADNSSQPAAASSSSSTASNALPQVCQDYLDKASACFKKVNPQMAAQFQKSLDQSKAAWAQAVTVPGYDKSQMESACKAAADSFEQTKSMLKCD